MTGERQRWCHKFATLEETFQAEETYRAQLRGRVTVTLRATHWTKTELHAARTQWGMDRSRTDGAKIGRPPKALNAGRARGVLAGWTAVHGRTEGLRIAADMLGVSVSTLRRAEREWGGLSKGVGGKGGAQ